MNPVWVFVIDVQGVSNENKNPYKALGLDFHLDQAKVRKPRE